MTSSNSDALVAQKLPDGTTVFGFDPAGAKFDTKWMTTTNAWGSTTGRLSADVDLSKLPDKQDYGKIDNSIVQKYYDKYVKHGQWTPDGSDVTTTDIKKLTGPTDWQRKWLDDKIQANARIKPYQGYTLVMPRGYGKNVLTQNAIATGSPPSDIFAQLADAAAKFRNSTKKVTKAIDKMSDGLSELRKANEVWEKKQADAKAAARLAVTEDKVYTFMEANYLPYDYARNLLEQAHIDSILNEGKANDTDTGA